MNYLFLLGSLFLVSASRPGQLAAQPAPAPTRAPHLAAYYEGTLNGKLPIHVYFFTSTSNALFFGSYYYRRPAGELSLEGYLAAGDSLRLVEQATPSGAPTTGEFRLLPYSDGSLRGTWQDGPGLKRHLPVLLRPVAGPGPAICTPARLTQSPKRTLPTIKTGSAPRDAQLKALLAGELAALAGDPGSQACTVTYFGHNLLSVQLSSETVGRNVDRAVSEQTVDLCTGSLLDIRQEVDERRRTAFGLEADRRLQQQLEAYIELHGPHSSEPFLTDDDVAGLRRQEFSQLAGEPSIVEGEVVLPYTVQYSSLTGFLSKDLNGRFGPRFTFSDLQAFLRPTSPLRRLVPAVPVPATAGTRAGR